MRLIAVLLDQGCMVVIPGHTTRFYSTIESLENEGPFLRYPYGTLDIFFDTSSAVYGRETISRKGLLKNWLTERLRVDDPDSHWIGYLQQDPTTYLFIDLHLSPSQRDWLNFLKTLPSPIKFVRLMPLEMASLAFGVKKPCTVITYSSKFLGLRQVVLHQGHFLLTRLVPVQDDDFEKGQLLTYLQKEYGIERDDVALIPVPFPFIPRSRKPVLSVRLKALEASRREAYCRKILLGLSICSIVLVIILSLYLERHRHNTILEDVSPTISSPPLPPIEAEKAALWDRYRSLRETVPDPLTLFERLSSWLLDPWTVAEILWHRSPQETIVLHLHYSGPRHEKKQALTDQIQKPFPPYTISFSGDGQGIQFTTP
jgi:hypothetical protein